MVCECTSKSTTKIRINNTYAEKNKIIHLKGVGNADILACSINGTSPHLCVEVVRIRGHPFTWCR